MTAEAASIRVSPPELEAFVAAAMQRVCIREEDARLAAQILALPEYDARVP